MCLVVQKNLYFLRGKINIIKEIVLGMSYEVGINTLLLRLLVYVRYP